MAYGRSYRSSRRAPARRSVSRKRTYKARTRAATTVQRAVRKLKTQRFNRSVQRAIRPLVEKKFKVFSLFDTVAIPGAGLTAPQQNYSGLKISNLLDHSNLNIEQGTGTSERIGNRIQNCKLRVKGYVLATDATTYEPFFVHLLVYKKKIDPSGDNTELLCKPGQTVGPFTYQISDQLMPWNRAAYTIKRYRVLKLRPPSAITSSENSIFNPQVNAPMCRKFAMDIPISSILKYDNQNSQAGAQTPNNDWVCFSAFVTKADGGTLAYDNSYANIYADATFSFTDA